MKALITLLGVVALVGCGSDDGEDSTAPADAAEIVATDFAFDPASLELDSAGGYTLRIVNEGEFPHALAFDDLEAATGNVSPAGSGEVEVDLEPGSYTIYCPVGDHRDRGMEGTIVVGGAEGAGAGGTTTGESGGEKPAYDYGSS